jgi:hypothetical protein
MNYEKGCVIKIHTYANNEPILVRITDVEGNCFRGVEVAKNNPKQIVFFANDIVKPAN